MDLYVDKVPHKKQKAFSLLLLQAGKLLKVMICTGGGGAIELHLMTHECCSIILWTFAPLYCQETNYVLDYCSKIILLAKAIDLIVQI